MTTSTTSSNPPPDIPPPPDSAEWDQAADQFLLNLLTNVQASAGVWGSSIAALLGLFGSIALVTGPSDVTMLDDFMKGLVVAMTIASGFLAGLSIVNAAKAQQLPSIRSEDWSGTEYRAYVVRNAATARDNLSKARCQGIWAAGMVFAMGVAVLIYAALQSAPVAATVK